MKRRSPYPAAGRTIQVFDDLKNTFRTAEVSSNEKDGYFNVKMNNGIIREAYWSIVHEAWSLVPVNVLPVNVREIEESEVCDYD